MNNFVWHKVKTANSGFDTWIAEVPGGWIVRTVEYGTPITGEDGGITVSTGMVFVPRPSKK